MTWVIACKSTELRNKPLAFTIGEQSIVLFRNSTGEVAALSDTCPHKGAKLSNGTVDQDFIRCPYHGWAFSHQGLCKNIPHLPAVAPQFKVKAFRVVEQQSYVWIEAVEDSTEAMPFLFSRSTDSKTFFLFQEISASLKDIIENQLDVTHTSTLHQGLFRSASKVEKTIEVIKTTGPHSIEIEYKGEASVSGLLGLLFRKVKEISHTDSVLEPWVTQVHYHSGPYEIKIQSAITEVKSDRCRVYTEVHYKLPFWFFLVKPLLMILVRKILEQDQKLLSQISLSKRLKTDFQEVKGPLDFLQPELNALLQNKTLRTDQSRTKMRL